MKSRNSDRHNQIAALLSEGLTQKQVAKQLGLSPSTVSRVLADHRVDDGHHPAMDSVDAFVKSLGVALAPDVLARVEALRALAAKLDWASTAQTGTAAMAASSLAKEYRNLLDELRSSASFDELREALLRDDDDD
jgi:transcriptional regulator with XRE-family HTH domain